MKLIAFTGEMGAGKTTAAEMLIREYGAQRVRFAGPLKRMLIAMGLTIEQVDGKLKEKPAIILAGRTPRYAMQTLGTEWGRNMIYNDLWLDLWEDDVNKAGDAGCDLVVVDDCRFPNEYDRIKSLGGTVVKIIRSVDKPAQVKPSMWQRFLNLFRRKHVSEANNLSYDAAIVNNSSLNDLRVSIHSVLGL